MGKSVQRLPGLQPAAVEPDPTPESAANWQQLGPASGTHALSPSLDATTRGALYPELFSSLSGKISSEVYI